MKTKLLILLLVVFTLGSCVKDDLSIDNSSIDNTNTLNRKPENQESEGNWQWVSFDLSIHYDEDLTQNEINIIRNNYFNTYKPTRVDIKLISSTPTSENSHEIWYGKEWQKGNHVTYPIINQVTIELDDEEGVDYSGN